MSTIKLKIISIPRMSGTVIVDVDSDGVAVSKFWRRRIKDSKIDGCVEVIKDKPKKPKPVKGDDA